MPESRPSFQGLAPTLLLSMPQLTDPNFERTVVLLCDHNEHGALGLVLNRPTDAAAVHAVDLEPPPAQDAGLRLWVGGPVEPHRGWILLGESPDEGESVEVTDGLYLSTSPSVLRRLIETAPARTRLLTGYAGWGPGQLDAEIAASAWLTTDVDLDLIFDTPSDEMWEKAIRGLGVDPAALQISRGIH